MTLDRDRPALRVDAVWRSASPWRRRRGCRRQALGARAPGCPTSGERGTMATVKGHLYWSNPETSRGSGGPGIDTIARAHRDGTGVEKSLITGVEIPGDVAVSGNYIYWANGETNEIGRAKLDGTLVDQSFISVLGPIGAVAVGAGHIYWGSQGESSTSARIGRANLDGSHVDQSFVSVGAGSFIGGLAVDRRHIYWTNRDEGTLGRADLTGAHVNQHLINGAKAPTGLALDGRHLYWGNDPTGGAKASIARATLTGSHVSEHFIAGVSEPFGVAVDSQHVYWSNFGTGNIGRANRNGSDVNQSFIVAGATVPGGESAPMGLATGA